MEEFLGQRELIPFSVAFNVEASRGTMARFLQRVVEDKSGVLFDYFVLPDGTKHGPYTIKDEFGSDWVKSCFWLGQDIKTRGD